MEGPKFEKPEESQNLEDREAVGLSPEQRKIAEKAELIVDNVKLGMGGSKKEIRGFVTIGNERFWVNFEETKKEDPNIESKYHGYILGDRDSKGDEYWKQFDGEAAKKFFKFYLPITKPGIDFEKPSKTVEPKTVEPKKEDKSIEEKLLGGE